MRPRSPSQVVVQFDVARAACACIHGRDARATFQTHQHSPSLYHSRFTIYDLPTMAKWTFEPGHTAAEFCARHMMVTYVRGHFKDVHGSLNFDPKNPAAGSVEVTIDARKIWTGEPARDAHLRSAEFLDAVNFPTITFRGNQLTV